MGSTFTFSHIWNEIYEFNEEQKQKISCQKQWNNISEILSDAPDKLNEGDYIKLCENLQYIYNNYVTKNEVKNTHL